MKVPEQFRVRTGRMGSSDADGNNGMFMVKLKAHSQTVAVIASDQGGWEHVSVSRRDRCPTWAEIAHASGMPLQSICGRVNELVAAGRLENGPRRICSRTGNAANPLRLPSKQLQLI